MSKPSPRRLKKKKLREKEAKKKVLARRNAIRAVDSEENKDRKKMKRISKLQKDMVGLNQWADDVLMNLSNSTLSQLEKNAKILKEIEKEYDREVLKKNNLNKDLEEKGLVNMEDKLSYLHNQLVEQQKNSGIDVFSEATENFEPKKEIAEVTVCKSPDFDPKNEPVQENSEQS